MKDFISFIDQTGTKHFALNIDFGIFPTEFGVGDRKTPGYDPNGPSGLIPLLPYIRCCHAKFNHMSDDFEETIISYRDIVAILEEHNWDEFLLSECEGADKYDDGYEVGRTLRKHHIMLKNYLGI